MAISRMLSKFSLGLVAVFILALLIVIFMPSDNTFRSPVINENNPRRLLSYTYGKLRKRSYQGSQIVMDKIVKDDVTFTSQLFFFSADNHKISGLMNIPKSNGSHPVIIMIRGYADPKNYNSGLGTQHAGEVFAQNGFVTLAPDFLGYGQSDASLKDDIEDRFFTYISMMELLASVKNITNVQVDPTKIGIWAHSNGGQITLSILEISGKKYPTVLWAPVSKPFPESVLYYASELDDKGLTLRKAIERFLQNNSPIEFSPTSYFFWIQAPMQLHQGEKDEEVPREWSDDLYQKLKGLGINIQYFTYPHANHNFNQQDEWQQNVERNIEFYKKLL